MNLFNLVSLFIFSNLEIKIFRKLSFQVLYLGRLFFIINKHLNINLVFSD